MWMVWRWLVFWIVGCPLLLLCSGQTTSVSVVIHRNGEADSCGSVLLSMDLLAANTQHSKYHIEHLLTQWIAQTLSSHECMGLYHYCDMGPERTPILWVHPYREHVHHHQHPNTTFLPCQWHTQNGQRVNV